MWEVLSALIQQGTAFTVALVILVWILGYGMWSHQILFKKLRKFFFLILWFVFKEYKYKILSIPMFNIFNMLKMFIIILDTIFSQLSTESINRILTLSLLFKFYSACHLVSYCLLSISMDFQNYISQDQSAAARSLLWVSWNTSWTWELQASEKKGAFQMLITWSLKLHSKHSLFLEGNYFLWQSLSCSSEKPHFQSEPPLSLSDSHSALTLEGK